MKRPLLILSFVLLTIAGFSQKWDIPPQNFTASYQWNDGAFGARLTWEKDQSVNLSLNRYHIFRGMNPNQLREIAHLVNIPFNYHYEYLDEEVQPDHYYYMVSAEYNDGSVCYSDTLNVYVTSTIETTDQLSLYPNPTSGKVTLHAENLLEVCIINPLGQRLLQTDVQGDVFSTDLSTFGKGLYLMLIRSENKLITKKIIVK